MIHNINGIGFENFKSFTGNVFFDFKGITLLTGTNNSGKSSLLNGIKLIKENFKDLDEKSFDSSELGLDYLLNREINTGDLLKRFGNLEMFVNKHTDKKEFSFLFDLPMIAIDDAAIIEYTIAIKDNFEKTGEITTITIKSKAKQILLFSFKKKGKKTKFKLLRFDEPKESNENNYSITINFTYFFQVLFDRLNRNISYYNDYKELINLSNTTSVNLQDKINNFNQKFNACLIQVESDGSIMEHPIDSNPNYLLSIEEIKQIIKEVENGRILFTLESLGIAENEIKVKELWQLLHSYYNENITECYTKFTNDILTFFDSVEWYIPNELEGQNNLDAILKTDNTINEAISLKRFINLFTNIGDRFRVVASYSSYSDLVIKEEYIREAIIRNEKFYNQVFKKFLRLLTTSDNDFIVDKDSENTENLSFKNLAIGKVEYYVSKMITQNVGLIIDCLKSTSGTHISTNRHIFNRVFTLSDNDNFIVNPIRKIEKSYPEIRLEKYAFINKWLKIFNIADQLFVEKDVETDNFKIYFVTNGYKTLLADYGFGSSQLLPLLLSLIPENEKHYDGMGSKYKEQIIIIEEPEANLHPALQSKLADLFAEAIGFNIKLIIETHSEYLIRKLQYLVASNKSNLTKDDVIIHYLYPPNHPDVLSGEVEQVEKIEIDEFGRLNKEFGKGFFDEADSIAMELFLLQQSQSN